MDITLSTIPGRVSIHSVAGIQVSVDSSVTESGKPIYWQTLIFMDHQNQPLGEVMIFLESPAAALPCGDQPPYWGMDPSKPLAIVDGSSPF